MSLRGQALGEVAVPPLTAADRVRIEAVVDDQDPQTALPALVDECARAGVTIFASVGRTRENFKKQV